jgi:hypothetical protein
MKRFALRLLGLTTVFIGIGATFAATSFASGGPFMPCCFTGGTHNMACCIYNAAMQCCGRFF